jgi:hypothetical protein
MPLPSSRFAATLLALSTLALPAGAADNLLDPIGWSADEQRVAVRVFEYAGEFDDEENHDCPGYVDHKGETFRGALRFEVYEKGKRTATFPIQDSGKCTPPKTAKARLTQAKAELAKLGIDLALKQPGTELTPERKEGVALVTVKEGPGAPYTLEGEQQVKVEIVRESSEGPPPEEEDEGERMSHEHKVKGALVVFVRKDGERRKLVSKKIQGSYTPIIGEMHEVNLAKVWLSPTGKTAVFLSELMDGSMRGRTHVLSVMGAVSWEGAPLVLR